MLRLNCSHSYKESFTHYLVWKDTIYRGEAKFCCKCNRFKFNGKTIVKDYNRVWKAIDKFNRGEVDLLFMSYANYVVLDGEPWDVEKW